MTEEIVALGEGLVSMLEFCHKRGLTRENSTLERDGEKWSVRYAVDVDTGEVKIEKQ